MFFTEMKEGALRMMSEMVRRLWRKWELRGAVFLSLLLQFMLVGFGNRWKYQGKRSFSIAMIVWCTYLSADWVATVALSILLKSRDNEVNSKLVVFWAPFLLLHLGGPDTITAYSLSDNELWLRHLLGLFIQVGVAFYVYWRFWVFSPISFIAIPVFVAGIMKYGERIWLLRAASRDKFSTSVFSAPEMKNLSEKSGAETDHKVMKKYLDEKQIGGPVRQLHMAHLYYKMFTPLFSDLSLRIYKQLFSVYTINPKEMTADEAFNLVNTELRFLHDVLYTKFTVLRSRYGIIRRAICLCCTFSALIAFSIIVGEVGYPIIDIGITYTLLVGAVAIDVYFTFMYCTSDWTILWISHPRSKVPDVIYNVVPFWEKRRKRRMKFMPQYNLITGVLRGRRARLLKCVQWIDTEGRMAKFLYTDWVVTNSALRECIYEHLKIKYYKYVCVNDHDDQMLRKLLEGKGLDVLKRFDLKDVEWAIQDVEFTHSLLIWHIATDIINSEDSKKNAVGTRQAISKSLSDYMLYLLVACPFMLPVGISRVRYKDTCQDVKTFFDGKNKKYKAVAQEASNALISVDTDVREAFGMVGPTKSKSALFEGTKVANDLQELVKNERWSHEQKWEMVSEVWMDMLIYAASKCEWQQHNIQLSQGGELLTHIALLMAHMGLSLNIKVVKDPGTNCPSWDWEDLSQLPYYLA